MRARLRGRSGFLLCVAMAALAMAWMVLVAPGLALELRRWFGDAAHWIANALSLPIVAVMLFLMLRRTCSDAREEELAMHLQRQQQDLHALAGHLIEVQEKERRTLSRELHDDIGQAISAIKMSATSLDGEDDAGRREIVEEIVGISDQTIAKLRDISILLRPPQLDALGLVAALRWQCERLFRGGQPALELDLAPLPERPDPAVELATFRIAQEALTNVLRHSGASHVTVMLAPRGDQLLLTVIDDGRGFDPARSSGLGLITMRERAQQIGGTFDIETVPGAGTCVRACLPLRAPTAP
ncbi:sensor histidine kinase [Lysobacter sp. LF1]|uniref:Oxygen sensor histidine kinase NreB n=1 Tax=Lysobacter stagni TaxID=3045172 RepID=A0ABT6XBD8_9GAMM|nr:sensor histidine kinase [Lysobacter sp. LF1]MDI9237449.1 sensor histidine kinase [Lysobacter sp. LF1]